MGASLADRPFYRARLDGEGTVSAWTLDDLEDWAVTSGDGFAGRRAGDALPPLSLQLEATGAPFLWVGVDAGELRTWSVALERVLRRWGVHPGDTVAFFDYGSSPLVLLSAGSYLPRLPQGAADRLGADTFCNDGLATMARRMVDAIRLLRPVAVVLRADVLAPFAEAVDVTGLDLAATVPTVAIAAPDGAPFPAEVARYAQRWGIPIRTFLRADAALLVSGDCATCGMFHVDPELYRLEPLPPAGTAVTTTFAHTTPTVRYLLEGTELERPGCDEEPEAARLRQSQ